MWPFSSKPKKPEKIGPSVQMAIALLESKPGQWESDSWRDDHYVTFRQRPPEPTLTIRLHNNGEMKINDADYFVNRTERKAIAAAFIKRQEWSVRSMWDKNKTV